MRHKSRMWLGAMGLALMLTVTASAAFANAGPPAGKPAWNPDNPVSHDEIKSDHKSPQGTAHESSVAKEHDGPSGGDVE